MIKKTLLIFKQRFDNEAKQNDCFPWHVSVFFMIPSIGTQNATLFHPPPSTAVYKLVEKINHMFRRSKMKNKTWKTQCTLPKAIRICL